MMAALEKIEECMAGACAEVYMDAYSKPPWNEAYCAKEVARYITDFLYSDTKCGYVLKEGETVIGVALGVIIPTVGSQYFRLEDLCIRSDYQKMRYGKRLMEQLSAALRQKGWDSILLGTQRGYPSHLFYLKNGFREVDSVLLYQDLER